MRQLIYVFLAALAYAGNAVAQTASPIPPLSFPTEPVEGSEAIRKLGTVLAKPKGSGPFPAIVIMQTCSGATVDQRDWGRRAVDHGYVALIVDSMGPRRVNSNNCNLPQPRRAADALDARAHLKKLGFVDPARVGLMGFSAGASAALMISNHILAATQDPAFAPFPATVAFYGACIARTPAGLQNVFTDRRPDGPLLLVLGGADPQAKPSDCLPELERLKSAGADIDWQIYPKASHCFDCQSENGKVANNTLQGGSMNFSYDKAATADAAQRTFAFFDSHMKGG